MIFTREQWLEVYEKHRCESSKLTTRPNEVILSVLEHDAIEHGIHPTWVQWWSDPEYNASNHWANTLYVLLFYKSSSLPAWWREPCGKVKGL